MGYSHAALNKRTQIRHINAMTPTRPGRIYVLALCGLLWSGGVWAQSGGPSSPELRQLDREIKDRQQRQKKLQNQASDLQRQQKTLQKRVIELARDLRNIDRERDRLETRLYDLAVTESQFEQQLQKDRIALSQTLAGLQALQVEPPPAFAVHPDDALAAVQGSIVLAGVVPSMQGRARNLRDQLTELAAIRQRIDVQSAALIDAERDAAAAQTSLKAALAEKAVAESKARQAAAAEARAIARLVAQARNLRDLSRRLQKRQQQNPNVPAFAPPPGAFAKARGQLPLPVTGKILNQFGATTQGQQTAQGVAIEARPGAQITAPYDGRILYSGPFRQYGSIVILAIDGSYQMILAGMDGTVGYVGQDVLAGEPIGNLPTEKTGLGAVSSGRSQLYMELRYDGRPIDPMPWLNTAGQG